MNGSFRLACINFPLPRAYQQWEPEVRAMVHLDAGWHHEAHATRAREREYCRSNEYKSTRLQIHKFPPRPGLAYRSSSQRSHRAEGPS